MKKRLLVIALLVFVLTCLFAISAGAEDVNPEYNEQYVKTMTQNMTTVTLEDGTVVQLYDAQGYTLCYYWDDVSANNRQLLSVRTKDLKFNFNGTKLSSIYYGDEHLAGTAKAGKIVVINLRGVKNSSGQDITDFNGDNMFKEDSPLQYIFMPDSIENLTNYAFGHRDGSLSHLRGCFFSENSKLKQIASNTFMNARQLRGFYIPSGVTYVGTNGFQGCHNAFFVNDPYDFLTKPEVYYFPAGFYKAEGEAFDSLKYNLNNVLVFSADNITIENSFAFEVVACDSNGTKPVVVFTGNVASINIGYWNVSAIYFCNKNDVDATTAGIGSGSKTVYFCNADGNTNHIVAPLKTVVTDADCLNNKKETTFCFCSTPMGTVEVENTALGHNHDLENGASMLGIVYESFANDGYKLVKCERCDVTDNSITVPAIYTYLGFAVKEDGTSLTLGYTFNKEAYDSYIADNAENVVSFGFVAYATYEDESCAPLSANEGVISPANPAKTIFAAMSINYAAYDFVIRGFDETTQDFNIAMCAYTYDGNEIKYLCKNTEGVFGAYDVAYATTISKEA